jgi:hypothetical protein
VIASRGVLDEHVGVRRDYDDESAAAPAHRALAVPYVEGEHLWSTRNP